MFTESQGFCLVGPKGALHGELAEEYVLLLHIALPVVGGFHADTVHGDSPPQLQGCTARQLSRKRIQQGRLACMQHRLHRGSAPDPSSCRSPQRSILRTDMGFLHGMWCSRRVAIADCNYA